MLIGSMRYASHWTHEGINQSRRDDLEMLGYCILNMLNPNIDQDLWSSVDWIGVSQTQQDVQYYNEKMSFVKQKCVDPRYTQIQSFLQAVHKLSFAEDPRLLGP